MNNQEYEKTKQECREEFLAKHSADYIFTNKMIFDFAFDRAYALGKQENDADAVIQGWVGRDQDGYISLFKDKPTRDAYDKNDIPYGFWVEANSDHLELPITSFPDLTWDDEPQECEIIIKRKKNG